MESLVANYASSDEEEKQQALPSSSASSRAASFFSALPKPKSLSFFNSLPQPKQSPNPTLPATFFANDGKQIEDETRSSSKVSSLSPKSSSLPRPNQNLSLEIDADGDNNEKSFKSSFTFSSLPPPKSQITLDIDQNLSSTKPLAKRVVQFKPPIPDFSKKASMDSGSDESDVEDLDRRRREEAESLAEAPSVMSFLSSIPAPKNSKTLGVLPSSGSGRRSILEAPESVSTSLGSNRTTNSKAPQNDDNTAHQMDYQQANYDNSENYDSGFDQNTWNCVNYDSYGNYQSGSDQKVDAQTQDGNSENYADYTKNESSWTDGSSTMMPEISGAVENTLGATGKRRRKEIPADIVEVNQDELMKNRPREDQAKLTGIAFGPSYQAVSTKGKPSKLHKRKHQIGSLFFDMRQKETELAERRARGFLTKAETHAKYGW